MIGRKRPVLVDGDEHWRCSVCKEVKPRDGFARDCSSANGLRCNCKTCCRAYRTRRRADPVVRKMLCAKSRKWANENPNRQRENARAWKDKNSDHITDSRISRHIDDPRKAYARQAVCHAVKTGKLYKPSRCEICDIERPLEGHHDSYERDRRLVVAFICKRCHHWMHARLDDQAKGIWI